MTFSDFRHFSVFFPQILKWKWQQSEKLISASCSLYLSKKKKSKLSCIVDLNLKKINLSAQKLNLKMTFKP